MRRHLFLVLANIGQDSRRARVSELKDMTWNEERQQFVSDGLEYMLPGHGLYLFDEDGNVLDTVFGDSICLPSDTHYLGFVGAKDEATAFQAGFTLARHMTEKCAFERVQWVYEN